MDNRQTDRQLDGT